MQPSINGRQLLVVDHPALHDRLAQLRDRNTPTRSFRVLLEHVGVLLAYEATRSLPTREVEVETPLLPIKATRIAQPPVIAPILRAGLGLVPGFLQIVDDAVVAHLGFYRDSQTLQAVPYYANIPARLDGRRIFVLDPMLATGASGIAALRMLAAHGASEVTFVSVIAAPEGIAAIQAAFPDVRIVVGAVDAELNEHGYIVPGLGDAGDRLFGSLTSMPTFVAPRSL